MARPKKKSGFRSIKVNEIEYRWRFLPSTPDSILKVTLAETRGQTLVVNMIGWVDPWLSLSGFHFEDDTMYLYSDAQNEPETVTSKFARKAILFALENGWKPETVAENFLITSLNGKFELGSGETLTDLHQTEVMVQKAKIPFTKAIRLPKR